MTWEDRGGQWFGGKDVAEALNKGISYDKIRDALNDPNLRPNTTQSIASQKLEEAITSAQQGKIANTLGGEYVGGADVNLYQQVRGGLGESAGKTHQDIRHHWDTNPGSLNIGASLGGDPKYQSMYQGVMSGAGGQDDRDHDAAVLAQNQQQHEENMAAAAERARLEREQRDRLAEKARIEALKVKTSSPSAVQGGGALGIRRNASPAYRSGAASRGTSQFARTGKGSNIKGINIA